MDTVQDSVADIVEDSVEDLTLQVRRFSCIVDSEKDSVTQQESLEESESMNSYLSLEKRIMHLTIDLHSDIIVHTQYLSFWINLLSELNLVQAAGRDITLHDKFNVNFRDLFHGSLIPFYYKTDSVWYRKLVYNIWSMKQPFYKKEFTKFAMKTLFSLNLNRLLYYANRDGYNKDVTIASAHFLRSLYWKIGKTDLKQNIYWFIVQNQDNTHLLNPEPNNWDFKSPIRRYLAGIDPPTFDYHNPDDTPTQKQFTFSIWRGGMMYPIPHTHWICENKQVSSAKLLHDMVKAYGQMPLEYSDRAPMYVIAQKGSKIAFFVANLFTNHQDDWDFNNMSTITEQDRIEKEQGESEWRLNGMSWNRFVSYLPVSDNHLHRDNFIPYLENIGVELFKLPDSWKLQEYYTTSEKPGTVNAEPPIYFAVFWDLLNKDHRPFIDDTFKHISTHAPPTRIYYEKETGGNKVLICSKKSYLQFQQEISYSPQLNENQAIWNSKLLQSFQSHYHFSNLNGSEDSTLIIPKDFAETLSLA